MLQLDKWQKKVLDVKGHFVLCTGRQVGKTTIFAIKAAEYMIKHKRARILVVSLTDDQAQLIIAMTLNYLEENYKDKIEGINQWQGEVKKRVVYSEWKKRKEYPTQNKITLTNGSWILSRPVGETGQGIRGFTGEILIIDEASRMPESVFTAARPTLLTTGGKIWMCSTPYGKQGYFYESFLNKHNRFEVFHISSEEVIQNREISDSWTKTQRKEGLLMLEEEKKDMGELAYAQEYLGLFMEDLRRFFDKNWIKRVCILEINKVRNSHALHFLGLDIARMGKDLGTYEIIDKIDPQNLQQVESIVTKKQYTTETFDRILQLNDKWDFKKIGIDAGSGSLGVGILDFLLREPTLSRKVEALNNRQVVLDKYEESTRGLLKEDMYENVRALGERGFLRLLNDKEVIASLESVQIEFVEKEGRKTVIKIWGRDTHVAEGIIRAAWLANQKTLNTTISWM